MLFLQLRDVSGDAIELIISQFDVLGLPRGSYNVVYGFGVQQEAAVVAVPGQYGKIIEIFEIDGGVDLNRVEAKFVPNVIERAQDCREAIDAAALRELLPVQRINRNFQLVEF